MKVKTPALTEAEVAKYGPVVAGTCSKDIATYRLVPKTAAEMKSRSLVERRAQLMFPILARRRRSPTALTYMYSVGRHAIMYDIDH